MKNKLLLTLISIFIQMNVNAQSSPLWTETINSLPDSSNLFPVKTEVDIFGNVVTLCYQSDTPERNIFLRKFDTDGNVLWTQIFDIPGIYDPRGFDMAVDSSANIYVAGGVYSTMETPLLLKFNSSGNLVWRRDTVTAIPYFSFNQIILKNSLLYLKGEGGIAVFDLFGNEQWSVGVAPIYIAVDNAGRVVASLYAGATNLIRYNTDGSVDFTAVTIDASHIAIDYQNNIYLINSYGTYNLVRFDSSGTFSWIKEDIAVCPPFGDLSVELIIDWDQDIIAIGLNDSMYKYNYNGDFEWQRSMNGLDSYRISTALFSQNYILIAGTIQDSFDNYVRVATFDALGNQNWYGEYNIVPEQEFSVDMTFDDSGIYILEDSVANSELIKFDYPFVAGMPIDYSLVCVDSVWYDTLNPVYINVTIFNGNFAHMNYPSVQIVNPQGDTISNKIGFVNFFAQLGNTLQTYSDTITEFGITDFSQYRFLMSESFSDTTVEIFWCLTSDIADPYETHLGIYPNPASGSIHLMQIPDGEIATLQIFDSNGRLCHTSKITAVENEVDLEKLSSGMYFLRLTSKSGVRIGKVIKQ